MNLRTHWISWVVAVAFVGFWAVVEPASAGPLGTQIPDNCVAHTSFSGGADARGDYRCAGLAIEYHTSGVKNSPFPIWAGQWLFVDSDMQYRVGSCTFNKGVHPTTSAPSQPVSQKFPNDPTGELGSYLTYMYGDTRDNLTAAALWAVFHYYAQDAAGTNRARNGWSPLVPRLDALAAASGRRDLQDRAIALDAEARLFAGTPTITVTIDRRGGIDVAVAVRGTPLAHSAVTVETSWASPQRGVTDANGRIRIDGRADDLPPGRYDASASTGAPGPSLVFRGTPASPDPDGAQTLITGGAPTVIATTTHIDVAAFSTSTTVNPATSTSVLGTTSTTSSTSTTLVPTTVSATVSTSTTAVPTTIASTSTSPPPIATAPPANPVNTLPRTGAGDGGAAYLGTAFLVAGIGLIGTVRRSTWRRRPTRADQWRWPIMER